ncbi:T9SS type A sorting domain-containing protein [candidate division KSB1 bacterium]|nr:T9SS type A sorting domain-containing protein [candidate division KSB1 bacterium]
MSTRNMIFVLLFCQCMITSLSAKIVINKKDATVWEQDQTITGKIVGFNADQGILYHNSEPVSFDISPADQTFSVQIFVEYGVNRIYVQADSNGTTVTSPILNLTLGYKPKPEMYIWATVADRYVTLHSKVIDNPGGTSLQYYWEQDPANPAAVNLVVNNDSTANFDIPDGSPFGEYYYDLWVVNENSDSSRARTFVTVSEEGILPFQIKTDHADWINKAIIYEITPSIFCWNSQFPDITEKIPEIKELGVTTIYLQPVNKTHGYGHGYDFIDFFSIRDDLGTEKQLGKLISTAKSYGLRVLFDFTPNHCSKYHPYVLHAAQYRENSHYFHFFQRELDNVPYSDIYKKNADGFVYYLWSGLVNLNYHNPEVQRWMTEALKYWINRFDIDGYRLDAMWGVNARNPEYTQQLRLSLKRMKPELLLLAEDKATWPMVFEERFDVAYDWMPEENWISHWSWQTYWSETGYPTIFNDPTEGNRDDLLRTAITNDGNGYHPRAKILRYMENNDSERFIAFHNLNQTKMASAFMFSIHGIPLLFNGQESGNKIHPYMPWGIYNSFETIKETDEYGLFNHYKYLCFVRKNLPALTGDNFEQVTVSSNKPVYVYRRWEGEQQVFGVMNMSGNSAKSEISLPIEKMNIDSTQNCYLTDVLTGDVITATGSELQNMVIQSGPYSVKLYVVADSVFTVNIDRTNYSSQPIELRLEQNYPNPFNASTTLQYSVPADCIVHIKLFNILGREIKTLVNDFKQRGNYQITFDARDLASGIYFYRLEADGQYKIKKMTLLK